jgi:hypothetical protein
MGYKWLADTTLIVWPVNTFLKFKESTVYGQQETCEVWTVQDTIYPKVENVNIGHRPYHKTYMDNRKHAKFE